MQVHRIFGAVNDYFFTYVVASAYNMRADQQNLEQSHQVKLLKLNCFGFLVMYSANNVFAAISTANTTLP